MLHAPSTMYDESFLGINKQFSSISALSFLVTYFSRYKTHLQSLMKSSYDFMDETKTLDVVNLSELNFHLH
jgi:hypothetical protein